MKDFPGLEYCENVNFIAQHEEDAFHIFSLELQLNYWCGIDCPWRP
jgi:hypothetical protein